MILSFPLFYCILFKLIPSWKTFLQECRNQHWRPLPCDSRFQGQIFISDVEAGYMLQCKPLYFHFFSFIWSKTCMSYILAIPLLPVNSDTTVLKSNHFLPWSPPFWKFPVSFYKLFLPIFSLTYSEIPWPKMQPSAASLQQLFKYSTSTTIQTLLFGFNPSATAPELGK